MVPSPTEWWLRVVVGADETGIGAVGLIAPPSSKLCVMSILPVTDPVAVWSATDPTSVAAWTSIASARGLNPFAAVNVGSVGLISIGAVPANAFRLDGGLLMDSANCWIDGSIGQMLIISGTAENASFEVSVRGRVYTEREPTRGLP